MDYPYHTVVPSSIGTVNHIDDAGTIHMSWENESSLGLISGEDYFKIIKKSEHNKLEGLERIKTLEKKNNRLSDELKKLYNLKNQFEKLNTEASSLIAHKKERETK